MHHSPLEIYSIKDTNHAPPPLHITFSNIDIQMKFICVYITV